MATAETSPDVRDALKQAEAEKRFAELHDVAYELHFDLDPAKDTYDARAVVRFRCWREGVSTFLDFHGQDLLGLRVNGQAVDVGIREPYRIPLAANLLSASRENEVVLFYRNAYDHTGAGFHRFLDPEDGETYLFTDFEPYCAHRFFPCFDQPDLKAHYDVTVDSPAHWTVIANGAEISRESLQGDRTRRRFARLSRFSTYLMAVIAGPYESVFDRKDEIVLGVHCRKSLKPHLDPEEIFTVTKQGFEFYTKTFGCPYPFGKYDQIFVPEFNSGAMENVGAVTFNESQVFRDPPTETQRLHRAEVILHELAHMWFGNLVTMKWWDGLWLNESFATYIAFLAMAEATRFQACWQDFLGSIKAWAYREDQKPTTHPISGTVADTEQTFLNFDGITYGKGAAVLKQLRAVLGGQSFDAGLRLYFQRHALSNTTIGDFLRALAEAAGRDLGAWSKLWLETSGANTLAPVAKGRGSHLIVQEPGNGDAVLRPHSIEVGLFARSPAGAYQLQSRSRLLVTGAETPIPSTLHPKKGDILWCNLDDHAYAKVFLDEESLRTARESLTQIEAPLVRMGVWGTIWEMLREIRLAPRDFIGMVQRLLVVESETEILESVLRNAATVLFRYVPLKHQPALSAGLITAGTAALEHHPKNSDAARMWARALPGFATDASQASQFVKWLGQEAALPVEVDQGMRWRIVTRASAFGLPGALTLIEAESKRDPSDRGRKARHAALIAAPVAKSKRAAFDACVEPKGASADLLKNGMAAFWWPHQAALLDKLALEYFDKLPEVLAKEDLEYVARGFVRVFFPHPVASERVKARAETLLAGLKPSEAVLRRFLLEEVDELRRTIELQRYHEREA